MTSFSENVSLKPYNTFHIDAQARYFTEINTRQQLQEWVNSGKLHNYKLLWLGGGSNVLFTQNFGGLVIKLAIKGIEVIKKTETRISIKAQAGENWHEFVTYCVANGWGGLENLSLIPGNVGSCPIQNIGAYGVEVKDCIEDVEVLDIETHKTIILKRSDCNFGYRDSIFKRELKGKVVIVSVTFGLSLSAKLYLQYGAIKEQLTKNTITEPSIADVSNAVCEIRRSKLPDPDEIGNAGSFFKNPTVSAEKASELKLQFPAIVSYPQGEGKIKLAAGWLIEQCGWKGYRRGDAGVHAQQALVLVNYGNATGSEIVQLAKDIQASIFQKFGVALEMEVNII